MHPVPAPCRMIHLLQVSIGTTADCLDYMVAVGIHASLTKEVILKRYGVSVKERHMVLRSTQFLDHR